MHSNTKTLSALMLCVFSTAMLLLPSSRADAQTPAVPPVAANQEEYCVSSIARDIADMLLYAAAQNGKQKFDASQVSITVRQTDTASHNYSINMTAPQLPSTNFDMHFRTCIYEIPTYSQFATELLSRLNLHATKDGTVASAILLKRLSDADMDALREQNEFVSQALTTNVLNPDLQEEAALIRASFAFMDHARKFRDWSFAARRMTAHLALAHALRGGADNSTSASARISNAALCAISGRNAEAVELTTQAKQSATDAVESSILRTVQMLASDDPRVFKVDDATPLETRQYFVALARSFSHDEAAKYMEAKNVENSAAISRIMCETGCTSVGLANNFAADIFRKELADTAQDQQNWAHSEFSTDPIAMGAILNQQPADCVVDNTIKVITWNDVAQWHQRQLFAAVDTTFDYYNRILGLPDSAVEFGNQVNQKLWKLQLFPFAMALIGQPTPKYIAWAVSETTRRPFLVPAGAWSPFVSGKISPEVMENAKKWFGEAPLFGTASNADFYLSSPHVSTDNLASVTALRQSNPYDMALCTRFLELKYGKRCTPEQMAEAFGNLIEYNQGVQFKIARLYSTGSDPNKYIAAMLPLAERKPYLYCDLAWFCWMNGRPDDTWNYYAKGMQDENDRVSTSPFAFVWAKHLYDTGKRTEAQRVVDEAAKAYSENGLLAKARYCEMTGDFAEAINNYKKTIERYPDDGSEKEIALFYIRNRDHAPEYAKLADAAIAKYFPHGLTRDDKARRQSPPTQGIVVAKADHSGPAENLKPGDIITAVDGYCVSAADEFDLIRQLTGSDKLKMTWWDGKAYRDVEVPSFYSNIAAKLQTYKRSEAAP